MLKFCLTASAILLLTGAAFADPIEGNWKTKAGDTAQIAPCGRSYCITLVDGKYEGKQIGKMKAKGKNKYSGSITDPKDNRTYTGDARLSGDSIDMRGCVLSLFCKSQTWTRR